MVLLLVIALAHSGFAEEWATLRGRIVYDGTPPVPKRVKVDKDVEVCGKYDLYDESLIVNPQNRGLRDVIVRLSLRRGETIDSHPDYEKDAHGEVLLDNKCCRLEPHVTVMRTTQKLVIHNSDPKGDSIKIDPIKNNAINVTLPSGSKHIQEFPLAERVPARVSCAIHPWELGWLVITDHPYVAVSDENGNFEIRNIPVGKQSFMFWQEKSGYLAEVTVAGRTAHWRRGTTQLDLKQGINDLGEIVVQPALFAD
jgi:hypothetical protein